MVWSLSQSRTSQSVAKISVVFNSCLWYNSSMITLIFFVLSMIALSQGFLWTALLLILLGISIQFTITLIGALLFVIILFSLSGCSSFGTQMSDLNYQNGQSFTTSPCKFWIGNTCMYQRVTQ